MKYVVVYAGRFQPFHKGHYRVYKYAALTFGEDNVYITTSNSKINVDNPFTFKEKSSIITTMFGIPESKIIESETPYTPKELLNKFPDDTALIVILGNKDQGRLSDGKYFEQFISVDRLSSYKIAGYVHTLTREESEINVPMFDGVPLSGAQVRALFRKFDLENKKKLFLSLYDRPEENVFKLISSKLSPLTEMELPSIYEYMDGGTNSNNDLLKYVTFDFEIDEGAKNIVLDFIRFILDYLNIETIPYTYLTDDKEFIETTGVYDVGKTDVRVYTKKRALADILRSVAHEYVHHYQNEQNKIIGSALRDLEDEAHAKAGAAVTAFNKKTPENIYVNEGILAEGGAYGRIQYPFDDVSLKFSDIKQIVTDLLSGNIKVAVEKTDGINLLVSYKNGRVVFARNKGHLVDNGEKALSGNDVKGLFLGRGELEVAFSYAVDSIESMVYGFDDKIRKSLFLDGKRWLSMDIVYPETVNVVPYDHKLLILHHMMEFKENGVDFVISKVDMSPIFSRISDINSKINSEFNIAEPFSIKLPQILSFKDIETKYLKVIDKLKNKHKLTDGNTILDFYKKEWELFIQREYGEVPSDIKKGLVKRWACSDKSFRIKDIADVNIRNWARQVDKNDHARLQQENVMVFNNLFVLIGIDVLKNVESLIVRNADFAKLAIIDRVKDTLNTLNNAKDGVPDKLKQNIDIFNIMGGVDSIVPMEGILFNYRDKVYKLTGIFQYVNKILGHLKYEK